MTKIDIQEIAVKTNVWADKVFTKGYSFLFFKELEEYINENRHLHVVPSKNEVIENGINVSEMNVIMMKKIEELTLYLIEQNKKIEGLEKEVKALKNKK